jgi:hypothetical protein
MTPEQFREMALRLGAVEMRRVFATEQFRVEGRTLATLDWPTEGWVLIKLDPADQRRLSQSNRALMAEPTARGKHGITLVRLRSIDCEAMAEVLTAAWRAAYRTSAKVSAVIDARPAASARLSA